MLHAREKSGRRHAALVGGQEPGLNLEFVRERELGAMLEEGAAMAELTTL